MKRFKALNTLEVRERRMVLPIGGKRVIVYEIVSGKRKGMGVVQCSLYPNLGGVFYDLEDAKTRAYNIKRFHEKQLDIVFVEQ